MDAPTVDKGTNSATELDASWTAPTTTEMSGKPDVDDYDVRYKKTSDSTWTEIADVTKSTALSATLDSLDSGKKYEVQVRAGNAEGDGDWSESTTGITVAGGGQAYTRSIAENSAVGTAIGAPVTPNANSDYTYSHSLDGEDKDSFDIDSATGQIKVKSGNIPNYEVKSSYSVDVIVTVAAKSQGGANAQSFDPNAPGNYTMPVTISVTDVERAAHHLHPHGGPQLHDAHHQAGRFVDGPDYDGQARRQRLRRAVPQSPLVGLGLATASPEPAHPPLLAASPRTSTTRCR